MTSKTKVMVGAHFALTEFDCHDGTPVPADAVPALRRWCEVWGEPLRAAFGPVRVTSGYRTTTYNKSVGGAPDSFHVYTRRHPKGSGVSNRLDLAADVVPARGNVAEWQAWANRRLGAAAWVLGQGRGAAVGYPRSGFIHLDTGPRRTWAG